MYRFKVLERLFCVQLDAPRSNMARLNHHCRVDYNRAHSTSSDINRQAGRYIQVTRRPEVCFQILAPAKLSDFPHVENYSARDNTLLGYRHYKSTGHSNVKLYLLHSAGWQGMEFNMLASGLAYRLGLGDVYAPDLRGHSGSPVRRGDGSSLAAIKVPLLVISGSEDSVIFPEKSKSEMERFTMRGEYQIAGGENHLSIVNSPKTLAIIQNWMAKLR
jgi:alpha-beta hydrolase superfamily lysophospholipase